MTTTMQCINDDDVDKDVLFQWTTFMKKNILRHGDVYAVLCQHQVIR